MSGKKGKGGLRCGFGINCHIIDQQVAIAIKNPITPVERLLNNYSDEQFLYDLRDRIDAIVKQ